MQVLPARQIAVNRIFKILFTGMFMLSAVSVVFGQLNLPAVVDANVKLRPCVLRFSAHYTTIQAAINAAASGETILVCPGTYPEQLTIPTSVTIRGVSAHNSSSAIIVPPSTGLMLGSPYTSHILVQAPNVTLDSIVVDGNGALPTGCSTYLTGIHFDVGSSGTVNRVALRNEAAPIGNGGFCAGTALYVDAGVVAPVTIQNSSVRAFGANGIQSDGPMVVRNNVIESGLSGSLGGGVAIYVGSGASTVSNNVTSHSLYGIYCYLCSGSTFSQNTISADVIGIHFASATGLTVTNNNVTAGIQDLTAPSQGIGVDSLNSSANVNGNRITGVYWGIWDNGIAPTTIQNNTISDATMGIYRIAQNTVSGNNFINVDTLTQ